MEMNKTQHSINTGDKEEQIQTANNPDFKDYCKDTIKKCLQYWQRNRHVDQWTRKETLEINLYAYGQLNFDKGIKAIQRRKDSIFNKLC